MQITISKENYLKAIAEAESEGETVIPATLARWLQISPPAVTAGLRRLKSDGLVRSAKDGRITLTAQGKAIAARVLHRHLLIERMLAEVFGMEWYKVHDEAERLEHAVSQDFEERLVAVLGAGRPCPHGNMAGPNTPEDRRKRGWRLLSEVGRAGHFTVVSVFERDRRLLEFLDGVNLRPGGCLRWVAKNYDDTLSLLIAGKPVLLGSPAARRVWIKPTPQSPHCMCA
jgi:DtxR family Mn-dependent transcriptional regulator